MPHTGTSNKLGKLSLLGCAMYVRSYIGEWHPSSACKDAAAR